MKMYRGSRGIAPRILNLGPRWRRVVSFTPRPLYPQGKSPRYPLDRRLGGPQSRSGHGGEEKNSQPLPRESNPRTPIVQPVASRYTDWAILNRIVFYCTSTKIGESRPGHRLSWLMGFHDFPQDSTSKYATTASTPILLRYGTWSSSHTCYDKWLLQLV
jgi:hypothetical protein